MYGPLSRRQECHKAKSSTLTPGPFNQVWEIPQLWEGFVKCCRQTQPRSNEILLQLPPNRLADALSQSKDLADLLHK